MSGPVPRAVIVASHCSREAIRRAGSASSGAIARRCSGAVETEVRQGGPHVALLARGPLGIGVLLESGTQGDDELVVHALLDHAAKVAGTRDRTAPRLDRTVRRDEGQTRRARPRYP